MNKPDWNPELYLKFDRERIQPSIDLVSRIRLDNPEKITDIGCGPGNSTQVLVQRWPNAMILGMDNSPSMIEKARIDYPEQHWKIMDAGKDEIMEKYDLVFSNATIQWIPDHVALIHRFYGMLGDKGVLAVQIPLFWDMPLGKAIERIAGEDRWKELTAGVKDLFTIHDCSFYYSQLTFLFPTIELWESSYMHILESHSSILEMIRSTGLKPYLERIEKTDDRKIFEDEVMQEIINDYPLQQDGRVIFPFRRLFFIAYK
jgi:trans-aconitate 2-methyltransferase